MDLSQWLIEQKLTDAAFAARVGCNQTTIYRAKRGIRMPQLALLDRIERETGGSVAAADLFAVWIEAQRARERPQQASEAA